MIIRNKVISVAKKQLGACEPVGDDQYIRWYNETVGSSFALDVAWCAIFVSWVLRHADIADTYCPNFASCKVGVNWAKSNKCWKDSNYLPSPADLVFFDWDKNGQPNHVAIVVKHDANYLYTIEGNTSDMVAERTYALDDDRIFGYMVFDYDSMRPSVLEDKTEQTVTNVANDNTSISDIQKILNDKFGQHLKVDGIWGPKSKKSLVKAIQKALNGAYRAWLSVDGIWGPKSQKAWRSLAKGHSGDLVILLQIALVAKGADLKVDGIFGKKTLKAVKEFQQNNKLEADGIVGPLTINKLMK